MPRTVKALTHSEIANLKPKNVIYDVTDSKNLTVRIMKSGEKYFYFRYNRPHSKRRNNISLGQFPYLSLQQARKKRDELQGVLLSGLDPAIYLQELEARERNAVENTFQRLAERWHEKKQKEVDAVALERNYRRLKRVLYPAFANVPIDKIAPYAVMDEIKKHYSTEWHAIKQLITSINQIMRMALNLGLIEFNRCQNLLQMFTKPEGKNLPAVHFSEVPKLLADVQALKPCPLAYSLLQFQMLTMTRPTEARKAKWEEIDQDGKMWHIPAERMKTRKPHSVPLTAQALQVLEHLRPLTGNSPYIFNGKRNNDQPVNRDCVNELFRKAGYKGEHVAHGFRTTASTMMNEKLLNETVIEMNLAHSVGNAVSRVYNRAEYIEERRKTLEIWANFCQESGLFAYGLTEI